MSPVTCFSLFAVQAAFCLYADKITGKIPDLKNIIFNIASEPPLLNQLDGLNYENDFLPMQNFEDNNLSGLYSILKTYQNIMHRRIVVGSKHPTLPASYMHVRYIVKIN